MNAITSCDHLCILSAPILSAPILSPPVLSPFIESFIILSSMPDLAPLILSCAPLFELQPAKIAAAANERQPRIASERRDFMTMLLVNKFVRSFLALHRREVGGELINWMLLVSQGYKLARFRPDGAEMLRGRSILFDG